MGRLLALVLPRTDARALPAKLPGSSTSFNDPSREAEKEVKLDRGRSKGA
jgi:hypothetical protein